MSRGQARGAAARVTYPLMTKLVTLTLTVTACGIIISGVLVDANVRRNTLAAFEDRLSYETTMLGQMTASALFGEIDPTDTSLNGPVRELASSVRTQLAVIARDGTVVADSNAVGLPLLLHSQADAAEIIAARATGKGTAIRDRHMFVARAIVREGKTLGFARSSIAMSEIEEFAQGVRRRIAYGSALALLMAVAIGVVFSSWIVRPIRALSDGARRVGGGDFEHKIEVTTRDEIGELAVSFNEMTKSLRETVTTVAALDGRNRDMRLVLDNIDQGLLTVERSGRMSGERSAALGKWFGPSPLDERFADYIRRVDAHAAANFEMQFEELLEAVLPLRLLLEQLPKRLVHDEQVFELSYTPILDGEVVARLLIVISDVTVREAARRAEAEQRETGSIFERIIRNKAGVVEFFSDARERVHALVADKRMPLAETQRCIHTLKGNCGVFGLYALARLCHEIEEHMADSNGDLSPDDRRALDQAWARAAARMSAFLGDKSEDEVVLDGREYEALVSGIAGGSPRSDLARMAREWKLERVGDRLAQFASHARELSNQLGKCAVIVEVHDDNLRLPREVWRPFWASFIHVVRNAVDHGLETEDERTRAHKPLPARIRLGAWRRAGNVVVELSDDGRGIDWDGIATRARAAGLPADNKEQWVDAMFAVGLSSKTNATEVSGRGVGLSAARSACERLGGHVLVDSDVGRGSAFRFIIPVAEATASVPPARSIETEIPVIDRRRA